jgi:hypothetical protein
VFAVTENVSVGIGTLAALLERLAYNIMLVKNIFQIHFKLLQVLLIKIFLKSLLGQIFKLSEADSLNVFVFL